MYNNYSFNEKISIFHRKTIHNHNPISEITILFHYINFSFQLTIAKRESIEIKKASEVAVVVFIRAAILTV